ncbi:MAG TPA: FkbM family methyltransferase [Bordetella sp.]|nr:FkbM family methyltransferase [Bordetella sp.]
MSLVSYAQNREDVMLWRALGSIAEGFYIDVGANDPETDSATKVFYDRGWHGINIEPLQSHLKKLRDARPRDINLGCAAGAAPGQFQIWECRVRGWATMDADVAARHEADGYEGQWHRIDVRTLADICAEHAPADIHFLKIDVEGFEHEVLRGMDFTRFRPWIVVAEAMLPNSKIENYADWDALLREADYLHAYSDGLNRFYVAREHQELLEQLKYPPNVFDAYNTAKEQALHQWAKDNETIALDARDQAETLRKKIDLLQAQMSAATQRVADRDAQLNEIFKSRSWRVTLPLRWLGVQRTRLREQGIQQRVRRGLIQVARLSLNFVRSRPGLRSKLARIAHHTGLYRPLFRVYSRLVRATTPHIGPGSMAPLADALLTPRGRRVYNDLRELLRKENR